MLLCQLMCAQLLEFTALLRANTAFSLHTDTLLALVWGRILQQIGGV